MSKDKKRTSMVPKDIDYIDTNLIPDLGYSELSEIEKGRMEKFRGMLKGGGLSVVSGGLAAIAVSIGLTLWLTSPFYVLFLLYGLVLGAFSGGAGFFTMYRLAQLVKSGLRGHLPRSERAQMARLEGLVRYMADAYNERARALNEGLAELRENEEKVCRLRDPTQRFKELFILKQERDKTKAALTELEKIRDKVLQCIAKLRLQLGTSLPAEPKLLKAKNDEDDPE